MKALFVQLFPRQFQRIQDAYRGPLELDFIDSAKDEGIDRLKAKAESADKVILITKFMSHKQMDVIPRNKVVHLGSVNIDRAVSLLCEIEPKHVEQPVPKRQVAQVIKGPLEQYQEERRMEMSTSTTRQVGNFVFTNAVPPPESTRFGSRQRAEIKWPLEELNVGESFFIDCKDNNEVRKLGTRVAAQWNWVRKHTPNKHFVSAKSYNPLGVRVWRIEDYTEAELQELERNKQKLAKKKKS